MLRKNVSSKLTRLLGVIAGVSGFLVVALAGLLKLETSNYSEGAFRSSVMSVQNSAWWVIPTLAIIAGISQRTKQGLGSTGTWRLVDHLLSEYRGALFENRPAIEDDPEHFHRITLFRHVRWRWHFSRWPWNGWMVPIARTGHTTMARIPRFRANANNPDAAHGVVGQAWAQNRTVAVHGLPEIRPDSPLEELESYANRTFVSVGWLRRQEQERHTRSFLGIPLEVNGTPRGAIVVDSRSPEEITTKQAVKNAPYKTLTEMLSKLLQQ